MKTLAEHKYTYLVKAVKKAMFLTNKQAIKDVLGDALDTLDRYEKAHKSVPKGDDV